MSTKFESILSKAADRPHDVVCVGTALIDFLSFASLSTVAELGLAPGTMTLIDDETAKLARTVLGADRVVSGGTVANTAAGIASFGGHPAFVGAIADDEFGERYALDLKDAGVEPMLHKIASDGATGACYVMSTPDQERTMATHLGVSGQLNSSHVTEDLLGLGAMFYFDGYLLDFPDADAMTENLIVGAQRHDTLLALGLADPFVVERHRDRLIGLLPHVSLLFSNADEICALAGIDDPVKAAQRFRHGSMSVVVTRSEHGAVVITPDGEYSVEAVKVPEVIDVTGAGDLFAAGMLFGCTHLMGFDIGAHLGALAAAEVIGHLGARPETSLHDLAVASGVIG